MKNAVIPILLAVLLLTGCAKRYRSISPETIVFSELKENDGLLYSYEYDMLSRRGNKRYAKKQAKKNIQVATVHLVNNTDKPLVFGQDIALKADGTGVLAMTAKEARHILGQNVGPYLLYCLLSSTISEGTDENGELIKPVLIPWGVPIALGNILFALNANTKFANEIAANNIINKTIAPGERISGIICFSAIGYPQLNFEVREHVKQKLGLSTPKSAEIAQPQAQAQPKEPAEKVQDQSTEGPAGISKDELLGQLFYAETDQSFEAYLSRLQNTLSNCNAVKFSEISTENYENGGIKAKGVKAMHQYSDVKDTNLPLGTWQEFNEDGTIKALLYYDLNGQVIKQMDM